MRLQDPWASVLAGLIALPLLLLLYFLKLRRRRVRVSSTLLWEWAVEDLQVNEPFRWLRWSVLLLVQLAAVVGLVLALGRPAVPGSAITGGRVLLLIDRSASMSAGDGSGGGTRLEEAKRRAVQLIGDLPSGSGVQVAAFAATTDTLTAMTTDHAAAVRAVQAIAPTDQPGSLDSALRVASALAGTSDESASPQAVRTVLLSDGGLPTVAEPTHGLDLSFVRVGPRPEEQADNVGIVAASARRDFDDPAVLRVFVRLVQTTERELSVPLLTTLDDRTADRRVVRVPPAVDGQPGSATATIELDPAQARRAGVMIERPDGLAADNRADLVLPAEGSPEVVLVNPTGRLDDPADPVAWVVGDVLEAIAGPSLRLMSDAAFRDALLETGAFDEVGLVVFDRAGEPGRVPRATLSFGLALPGAGLLHDPAQGADRFVSWTRDHPSLRGLSLDSVTIASPGWFDISPQAEIDTIASGRFGPVLVASRGGLHRRIACAFDPAASTWPLQEVSFPLFVAQAFDLLTAQAGEQGLSFRSDQPPEVRLPAGVEAILTGPAVLRGRVVETSSEEDGRVGGGEVRAIFAIPEQRGVYAAGDHEVAVNLLDSLESSLRTSDSVSLGGRGVVRTMGPGEGQREVWRWFVLAAVVLTTIEWMLFASRARI